MPSISVRHEGIAACSLSPIAGGPSVLPYPIVSNYGIVTPLPPVVSNSSCLFTQYQPMYASRYTISSRYCTVRLKFLFFVF